MMSKKTNKKIKYVLKLYVTGQTTNSVLAIKNLKEVLDSDPGLNYELKIIDILKNPQLAEDDKILAAPTLTRTLPSPAKRIIGNLSNKEKVLIGLDIVQNMEIK